MDVRNNIPTLFTLVNVFGTIQSFISGSAGTGKGPVDRTGVADCTLVARIRRASIVEMAKQACETKATVSP